MGSPYRCPGNAFGEDLSRADRNGGRRLDGPAVGEGNQVRGWRNPTSQASAVAAGWREKLLARDRSRGRQESTNPADGRRSQSESFAPGARGNWTSGTRKSGQRRVAAVVAGGETAAGSRHGDEKVMSDLVFSSATETAARIRKKEISPVDVVEAYLAQIDKLNPRLNAFVQLDEEGARRAARDAAEAIAQGGDLGPLHGVPISVKSSIEVAGLRCEAGTRLRAGYVARQDAPLVARLKRAGAIVLGTTNTPELLMAWETDNLLYGRTNSPWNLERTPGGSSGGEAAAIAAGMSAGGVGSDGGGSIRVPSHFSGICGLKPTPGRIPSTGHFPPSGGPFALIGVVGPMARTVSDLKLLFEVMQGPDDGESCAAPVPVRWPSDAELKRLRIGYFEDDGRTPVTSEIRDAVRTAAEALRRAGFEVEPFRPAGLEEARVIWKKFFVKAGGMLIGPMFHGRESDCSSMLNQFLAWSEAEPELSGE